MSNTATFAGGRLTRAYGEIYAHDNTTTQDIPTGTTYIKITPEGYVGAVKNCTPKLLDGEIQVDMAGLYEIVFTATSKIDTNQVAFRTVIFKNGIELNNIHAKRVIKLATEETSVQIEGFAKCEVGDIIDCRVRHDDAGTVVLTTEYANLNINRIDI